MIFDYLTKYKQHCGLNLRGNMDIKSIFKSYDKTKCPKTVYSSLELSKIMDYLYNKDFDFCLAMGAPAMKDVISGDLILIDEGSFLAGEYLWSYYEPMYVFRYGLELDANFRKQIEQFYQSGKKVTDLQCNWKQQSLFYKPIAPTSPMEDEPR